jgi:hypothetical protein
MLSFERSFYPTFPNSSPFLPQKETEPQNGKILHIWNTTPNAGKALVQ